jgi:hypothetical protein
VVILGAILLILGLVLGIQILWIIGAILLVLGLVGGGFGYAGRPIYGRQHWW